MNDSLYSLNVAIYKYKGVHRVHAIHKGGLQPHCFQNKRDFILFFFFGCFSKQKKTKKHDYSSFSSLTKLLLGTSQKTKPLLEMAPFSTR